MQKYSSISYVNNGNISGVDKLGKKILNIET